MRSWKKHLPDYEFKLWNFDCFDKRSSVWVQEAFEKKKYAFAADYIRLYALYNHGGFYLDMDVEVLKSLNDFLNLGTVLCWQDNKEGFEAACMGASKYNPWVKEALRHYENRRFIQKKNKMDITPLPEILESCFKSSQIKYKEVDNINQATSLEKQGIIPIFHSTYFSPKSYKTHEIIISEHTYAIHHFAASWVNKYDNLPWYAKIWKFLHLPDTNILKKLH